MPGPRGVRAHPFPLTGTSPAETSVHVQYIHSSYSPLRPLRPLRAATGPACSAISTERQVYLKYTSPREQFVPRYLLAFGILLEHTDVVFRVCTRAVLVH